jgi:signal peptidase II
LGLKRVIATILIVLALDQWLKIWVKTTMELGQETALLGDWVVLSFTENLGMAFGMVLPEPWGKIALSLFRVLAVIGIAFYLRHLIKKKVHKGLLTAIALICAGALGNILDSAFYGSLFNMGLTTASPHYYFGVAEFVWGTDMSGYAAFLQGSVVDMIKVKYFPAVFNLADMSISFGVALIIIFQKRYFAKTKEEENKETDVDLTANVDETAVSDDSPAVEGSETPEVEPATAVATTVAPEDGAEEAIKPALESPVSESPNEASEPEA